jgi:cytochrome b pre-mRNA-processing protein 3
MRATWRTMNLLQRLFASKPDPREALRPLWQAVVNEARRPEWYTQGGALDTVPGRFDMVTAVLALVLVRMEQSEDLNAPTVILTSLYIDDMDGQMRVLGIGDPVVGKHVGKVVSAMGGRLAAYREGLEGGDALLTEAVSRNLTMREGSDPTAITAGLRRWADRLARTSDAGLLTGATAP